MKEVGIYCKAQSNEPSHYFLIRRLCEGLWITVPIDRHLRLKDVYELVPYLSTLP